MTFALHFYKIKTARLIFFSSNLVNEIGILNES